MVENKEGIIVKDLAFDKVTLGGLAVTVIVPNEFEIKIYGINDEDDWLGFSVKEEGDEVFERDIDLLSSDYDKYLELAKSFVTKFNLLSVYKKYNN